MQLQLLFIQSARVSDQGSGAGRVHLVCVCGEKVHWGVEEEVSNNTDCIADVQVQLLLSPTPTPFPLDPT